jgi:hypothetical protein
LGCVAHKDQLRGADHAHRALYRRTSPRAVTKVT